ncbi:MAG: hypothetical protein V1772_11840 [Chloroflexota bacterium]
MAFDRRLYERDHYGGCPFRQVEPTGHMRVERDDRRAGLQDPFGHRYLPMQHAMSWFSAPMYAIVVGAM